MEAQQQTLGSILYTISNELHSLLENEVYRQTQTEHQLMLQAKMFSEWNKSRIPEILQNIHNAEFKVFSQFGDDGIIQFLANYLDFKSKTFVEFGVEDYKESNTRFLLQNNNWSGFVMDGTADNVAHIATSANFANHDLYVTHAFVTAENINELLLQKGFTGDIGIFHIDIDGNDYWIWKAITVAKPIVMIVEFNSVFGYQHPWVVPYKTDFFRRDAHYSWLYSGCSIAALCHLAAEKGYSFIGCNSAGNNAYFVRNDKLKELKPLTPQQGYVESRFRESRNEHGEMTFLSGTQRLALLNGLPIFNTVTEQLETINISLQ